MVNFPIGVMIDSFKLPMPEALKKAAEIGAKGLQLYATRGNYTARALTPEKRKELLQQVKEHGLVFSALCGDFGHGFMDPARNPELIEESKRVVELAKDLQTDIITTHIGVVPKDKNCDRYKIMQEACFALSRFADEMEAHFAVETGPETAAVLKGFLDDLDSKGVAVNLDPANFVMVTGDDPVQAVYTLKDYIVHTHAKDGRRLYEKDPEIVYGVAEELIPSDPSFVELPLGEGDVDFDNYLKALEEVGYRGFLTIEREVGDDPAKDIGNAAAFLKNKISQL